MDHGGHADIGLGWMMAEDCPRQVFHQVVRNQDRQPLLKLLVRSWLNPSRSFANIFAGTRRGIAIRVPDFLEAR